MRRTKDAFVWIVGVLRKHRIAFQLTGGMAARVWGSSRPLFDIDIELHNSQIQTIMPDVAQYIVYGPKRYVDKNWDLMLMTLQYRGQLIDICGCNDEWIFDKTRSLWCKERIILTEAKQKSIHGLLVPVISKERLISYKKRLGRRVDKIDIVQLEKNAFHVGVSISDRT